jgi:hypothetical protein
MHVIHLDDHALPLAVATVPLFRVVNRKKRQGRAVTVASQEPVNSR